MSPQETNARILNQLWRMGEEMFAPITRMVEEAEKNADDRDGCELSCPECQYPDECYLCGGTGEYTLGRSDSDWGEVVKCECAK